MLAISLAIMALGSFTPCVVYYIRVMHIATIFQLPEVLQPMKALIASFMIGDFILAAIIIYFIQMRRTDFAKTNTILNRVMALTVGTGLINSIWAMVGLIAAVAWPDKFLYFMVALVMPRSESPYFHITRKGT